MHLNGVGMDTISVEFDLEMSYFSSMIPALILGLCTKCKIKEIKERVEFDK